jgi:hypothetical protein
VSVERFRVTLPRDDSAAGRLRLQNHHQTLGVKSSRMNVL